MDQSIFAFIDEAVKIELNMSRLYSIFSEYIDEDRAFWNRLETEERNHAALLKTAKEFVNFNKFPNNLVPENLEALVESNRLILETIDQFIGNPGREMAFSLAIELEKSAGEVHFQHFMEEKPNDKVAEIFQQLNRSDKDHAERISLYWQEVVRKND
jgi:hypothetical protein